MHASDSTLWEMECQGVRWQKTPPILVKANTPDVLKAMALAGAGLACLAEHYAKPEVANGQLTGVLTDWRMPGVPVWAVFPGRRLIPARTRIFIDALKQHLNEEEKNEQASPAVSASPTPGT